MRSDIPSVVQTVQACHAAHEAGAAFGAPVGCHLILVAVPDGAVLETLVRRLGDAGLRVVSFREPDLDPILPPITAIATLTDDRGRRWFRHLPLWRPIPDAAPPVIPTGDIP